MRKRIYWQRYGWVGFQATLPERRACLIQLFESIVGTAAGRRESS
jgi:hypothetical protein